MRLLSTTSGGHLPRILQRSFAPPRDGYFVAGMLKVEHQMPPINFLQQRVLGIIPPSGTLRTVVRFTKDEEKGTVQWLRLFDDGKSTFSTDWTMDGPSEPTSERFAGVIDIAQRLECTVADDGGVRATLRHVSTSVRGLVPVPVWLMETCCVMDSFADDGGSYDLSVTVTLCGRPMVCYTGRLRECEGRPSEFLSTREAKGMGVSAGP